MSRGLDHIVHAVRDLDVAVELYRRLGFQVGARNRHPRTWGTQNHTIQLPGTYIELLTVADASGIAPHAPRYFSFGAFNRDFLKRRQGLSMLALEGRGAPDAEKFRAQRIGDFELYELEREGKRPDGTLLKLSFALSFACNPHAPEVGFFTSQHRHPENFWNPAFQVHANTVTGVAGVVLVAEKPSDHRNFLAAFSGAGDVAAASNGVFFKTARGDIGVMTPAAVSNHYGVAPPDTSHGARLTALRFSVSDMAVVKSTLEQAKIPTTMTEGAIVIGPQAALGAVLVFEP